jgi:hypothetical protein
MPAYFISLLFCIALLGCATAPKVVMLSPSDPTLSKKLELVGDDWRSIEQLAARESGWVMLHVARVSFDTVEIHFKRPDDRLNDRGGPVRRYQKKEGAWRLTDYLSEWAVHLVI